MTLKSSGRPGSGKRPFATKNSGQPSFAETVLRFFRALRFAQSLTHAIEVLGVPYSEFEAKWLEWSSRAAIKNPDVAN